MEIIKQLPVGPSAGRHPETRRAPHLLFDTGTLQAGNELTVLKHAIEQRIQLFEQTTLKLMFRRCCFHKAKGSFSISEKEIDSTQFVERNLTVPSQRFQRRKTPPGSPGLPH
jgi:hypothetical protein